MPSTNDEMMRNRGQADINLGANVLQDDLESGKQIAAILDHGGYHPMIGIGTALAGKSTLTASLLARRYARDEPTSVAFRFAEKPIFPESHPLYGDIATQTKEFCEGLIPNFAAGQLVPPTHFLQPYFIPAEIIPKNPKLKTVKLAFLECRGALFDPIRRRSRSDGREYLMKQDLPEIIAGVLLNFNKPVSFLYVAPGKVDSTIDAQQQHIADLALLHGLENCSEIRTRGDTAKFDRHLCLLTLWDEREGGVGTDAFARPDAAEVERVLATDFPEFWHKYANLRAEARNTQHHFMQYSAGPVFRGQVVQVAMDSWPILNRHCRSVLNWLYSNASNGNKVLFPDVMAKATDRALRLIGVGR